MNSIEKLIQTKIRELMAEERKRVASSLFVSEDAIALMHRKQKKMASIQKQRQALSDLQAKAGKSKDPAAMTQKLSLMRQRVQLSQSELAAMVAEPVKPPSKQVSTVKESLLNEADPRPRVEKDHLGQPVVPTTAQYAEYFEAMASDHVREQLQAAKTRWQSAVDRFQDLSTKAEQDKQDAAAVLKASFASAALRALDAEMKAAEEVLSKKDATPGEPDSKHEELHDLIRKTISGLLAAK